MQKRINGVSECARFEQHYSSTYLSKPKPTYEKHQKGIFLKKERRENLNLLNEGNPWPLNDGLSPGGKGEICGRGNDEGGKGTCGLGPGNIEYVSYPVRLPSLLFPSMAA